MYFNSNYIFPSFEEFRTNGYRSPIVLVSEGRSEVGVCRRSGVHVVSSHFYSIEIDYAPVVHIEVKVKDICRHWSSRECDGLSEIVSRDFVGSIRTIANLRIEARPSFGEAQRRASLLP